MKCEFCAMSDETVQNLTRPPLPALHAHAACYEKSRVCDRDLREFYIRTGVIRPQRQTG
jgi:hypothetical protein